MQDRSKVTFGLQLHGWGYILAQDRRSQPFPFSRYWCPNNAPIIVMPHYPPCGQCRGFVGKFCQRTPRGGTGLVISTFHESTCKYACVQIMWLFGMDVKNTVILVHLQTSCGSRNKAVGFRRSTSCTTKTKFSDILFQNSKLLLLVSPGIVYSERPQWVGIS